MNDHMQLAMDALEDALYHTGQMQRKVTAKNAKASDLLRMYLENTRHALVSARCNLKNIVMIEVGEAERRRTIHPASPESDTHTTTKGE